MAERAARVQNATVLLCAASMLSCLLRQNAETGYLQAHLTPQTLSEACAGQPPSRQAKLQQRSLQAASPASAGGLKRSAPARHTLKHTCPPESRASAPPRLRPHSPARQPARRAASRLAHVGGSRARRRHGVGAAHRAAGGGRRRPDAAAAAAGAQAPAGVLLPPPCALPSAISRRTPAADV